MLSEAPPEFSRELLWCMGVGVGEEEMCLAVLLCLESHSRESCEVLSGSNSAVMDSFPLKARFLVEGSAGAYTGESSLIMLVWLLSLLLECPEASEQVMLSFPESYWLRGCSAGVMVTLGLPGLFLLSWVNFDLEERPRKAGLGMVQGTRPGGVGLGFPSLAGDTTKE